MDSLIAVGKLVCDFGRVVSLAVMGGEGESGSSSEEMNSARLVMGSDNPMENDVILKVLFDFCHKEDLPNVRLVCSKWRELSLPRWRRTGALILVESALYKQRGKGMTFSEYLRVSHEAKHRLDSKPFHNYQVHGSFAWNPELDRVWPQAGGKMKSVSLSGVNFSDLVGFIHLYSRMTPNLTRLHIAFPPGDKASSLIMREFVRRDHAIYEKFEGEVADLPPHRKLEELELVFNGYPRSCLEKKLNWNHFFFRFPNVKKLKLSRIGCDYNLRRIFQSIADVRSGPHTEKALQLQSLDIFDLLPNALSWFHWYGLLLSCDFPLKRLDLCVGLYWEDGMQELTRLLEGYAPTLQHLHLFHCPFSLTIQGFPVGVVMAHLTRLELRGNLAKNFDFLSLTPKLEVLSMIYDVSKYEEHSIYQRKIEHIEEVYHETLFLLPQQFSTERFLMETCSKHLRLEHLNRLETDFRFLPRDFKVMVRVLPQLTEMSLALTNKTFRLVCGGWPQLRKLGILWNSKIKDGTFTGVLWREVMKQGKGEVSISLQTGEVYDKEGKQIRVERRHANITDLQELTHLRLEPHLSRCMQLSDHAVLFGVLQLPHLRVVQVKAKSMLSETRQALERKLYDCQISTLAQRKGDDRPVKRVKVEVEEGKHENGGDTFVRIAEF